HHPLWAGQPGRLSHRPRNDGRGRRLCCRLRDGLLPAKIRSRRAGRFAASDRGRAAIALGEPDGDLVPVSLGRPVTRADAEDLELSLGTRGSASETDREVIVAVVRLGGGRRRGGAAELVTGSIQHDPNHRSLVYACGTRYLDR